MTPPIIHRPERQGRTRRIAYGTLTAAAWLVYFYLWLPLITLLAWVFGIRTAYNRLYLQQQTIDPFVLLSLPVIALVCGAILIGWAEYNRARFQKRSRRMPPAQVADDEVARSIGADAQVADTLRRDRIVRVALDAQARPVGARSQPAATRAPAARLPAAGSSTAPAE